jgi:hypothetical protein
MDNRKSTTDRRDNECKAWAAIMDTVRTHRKAADNVDKCMADLRSTVNKWRNMSTTKG